MKAPVKCWSLHDHDLKSQISRIGETVRKHVN
jgi:hypothetical protein